MDSFRTDDSVDLTRVEDEEEKKQAEPETVMISTGGDNRLTVIAEDEDESRASLAQIKPTPPPQVAKPEPRKTAPAIPNPDKSAAKISQVSQIKTNSRRISNVDRLKVQLAVRQATMHGGKKKRARDDSSDDNESSSSDG